MKPTLELLALARTKAATLPLNTQIRLTSDESSYYLFNFNNLLYIGSMLEGEQPLGKFFKNREVYTMADRNGKPLAKVQRL